MIGCLLGGGRLVIGQWIVSRYGVYQAAIPFQQGMTLMPGQLATGTFGVWMDDSEEGDNDALGDGGSGVPGIL